MTWEKVSASCHLTLWTMSWHTSSFKNTDVYYCNTFTAACGTSTPLTVLCLMITLLFFSTWTSAYVKIKCDKQHPYTGYISNTICHSSLPITSSNIKVAHSTASQQLIQAGLILRNTVQFNEIWHSWCAIIFCLTWFGMEETWLAESHVTVMCMD